MRNIVVALLFFLTALPAAGASFDHSYRLWNSDLKQFNEGGYIHYGAWQRNRDRLERYIAAMQAVSLPEISAWSASQRLAFWINAHNALVVSRLLDVYPNVRDLRKKRWLIAGQDLTITDIRDKILRGSESRVFLLSDVMGQDTSMAAGSDLRILFAINEGSNASPPLAGTAYTADRLSAQLDRQVRATLANPSFLRIEPKLKIFHVAGFFRTFQRDFKQYQGNSLMFGRSSGGDKGLLRFIFPYLDKPMQQVLLAKQTVRWRVDYRMSPHSLNGGE